MKPPSWRRSTIPQSGRGSPRLGISIGGFPAKTSGAFKPEALSVVQKCNHYSGDHYRSSCFPVPFLLLFEGRFLLPFCYQFAAGLPLAIGCSRRGAMVPGNSLFGTAQPRKLCV
jgi:hypothetical protein